MIETAVFGGGCFWCTEAIFRKLKGVKSVTSGYAGGEAKNPSYKEVSSGSTNHAEVIKIEFDTKEITYEDLLEVFFATHDPTTIDRQGEDKGSQYRSIILYTNSLQKSKVQNKIEKLSHSGEFTSPIVTQVKKLEEFYDAESYHQNFYNENKYAPYCMVVINPKLKKLQDRFADKLKSETKS